MNESPIRLEQAVRNNALWCEAVCRAHGSPGEFQPTIWLNRNRVPLYYPNAVTLTGESGREQQIAAIQELAGEASVKDSYRLLDLSALGFHALFDATWLWRSPRQIEPASIAGIRWTTVRDPGELARWESAWAGLSPDETIPPESRIFLPSLLADPDVVFVAAYRETQIVAGAIGNRTGDVVGLSNQFAPEPKGSYWTGCIRAIQERYPGSPLVGYEHGADLDLAVSLGFETTGPLRVWVHEGPASGGSAD